MSSTEKKEECRTSPSLPLEVVGVEEHTQPQQPHAASEPIDISVLSVSSPAVCTVEESEMRAGVEETTDRNADAVVQPATEDTPSFSQREAAADAMAPSHLLLGGVSEDLLPAPLSPSHKMDADDNPDGAWGAEMQSKYSATSEWVESLPYIATESPLPEESATSGTAEAPARRGKRTREGKGTPTTTGSDGGGTVRQRRAREKAAEAELHTAFQHSQRALRKQAKSINMKDVFSRSVALPSPLPLPDGSPTFPASPLFADGVGGGGGSTSLDATTRTATGHIFSPSSSSFRFGTPLLSSTAAAAAAANGGAMSPTTPSTTGSAWSPNVVGELTNNFLANVKHQRRQRFEQFVSRELTQSQTLSQTRSAPHANTYTAEGGAERQRMGDSVGHGAFSAPVDELVIGEEDNEAANWMPAEALSASGLGRRHGRETNDKEDGVLLLGGSSGGEEGRHTTPPSTVTSDGAFQQQQQQQDVVKSLARKHEIWKLKQRELKAQQQVDRDDRAKTVRQLAASAASASKVASTSSTAVTTASSTHTTSSYTEAHREAGGKVSVTTTASFEGFFRTSQISAPSSVTAGGAAARSLHKPNLSADAISMIRRINSFDNTSTQRVVVFGTAAAAAAKQSKDAESHQ